MTSALEFQFKSSMIPAAIGAGKIEIDSPAEGDILVLATMRYVKEAKTRTYCLRCIINDEYVLMNMAEAKVEPQLTLIWAHKENIPVIYYTSILPIDCGIIKPCDNISLWKEMFGIV